MVDDDDDDGLYAATTNERCGMYDAFIHFIYFYYDTKLASAARSNDTIQVNS